MNRRLIGTLEQASLGFYGIIIKDNRYTVSLPLISTLFFLAIGFMEEGLKYGWHDGVAIAFGMIGK